MVPQAGDLQISPQIATIESRSMDGRVVGEGGGGGGGVREERTGPCRWEIWLLPTSAFLNTGSYLPSPPEERSFPFFPLLLCVALLSASPRRRPPTTTTTSVPFSRSIYPPPSSTFHTLPSPLSLFLFSSIPASFFPLPPRIPTPPFFPSPSAPSLPPPPISQAPQWNGPFSNKTKLPTASHAG